jgi:tetratricopeptide (TPR) repeat protein
VQDEIAAAIAAKLQVAFDTSSPERATPEQVEVYETYLRGRAALTARVNLLEAVASFERVIVLDPRHARAYANLADTYRLLATFGQAPQVEAKSRAKIAVARALEINPNLADGLSTAAAIAISWENDPNRAIQYWQRALDLNPALSEARVMYALYGLLYARGDEPLAAAEARRAVRDDPQSSIVAAFAAQVLCATGHFDEGLTLALRAVQLDERSMTANATAALALCGFGDAVRAEPYAQRVRIMGGRNAIAIAISATVERGLGNTGRAEAHHRELLAWSELEDVARVPLAMSASAAGRADEAMDYAMQAFERGELQSGMLVRASSMFVAIREHPRFPELRKKAERWHVNSDT